MKKLLLLILLTMSIYGMQFDKFNGRVYFDETNKEERLRTDNIKLGIDIEKEEYDVVVFEFVGFTKIEQKKNIDLNKNNSLILELKNYDIYFLKTDIQEILDSKNSKEKIPNKIKNFKYKDWKKKHVATERAITTLFNEGKFKAYTKDNKEVVEDFQKGNLAIIYCYYKKHNSCGEGYYYSVADSQNEIIWYDEYRFFHDVIPNREAIQKYLKESHNIELFKGGTVK